MNIICRDSIEWLKEQPDASIDLVVTDPPYNSTIVSWDNKTDEWQFQWLQEAKRVLKDGASFYMFFAPMNMYGVEGWVRQNLTLRNIIVWHHANLYGAGMGYGTDRYKSTWDVVLYAVKGKKAKHGKHVASVAYLETGRGFDVMIYPQPRPLLHKAQKPLDLIKKFVICSSNEGDVVLDPFCGAGTTGIACKTLNRDFILVDNDPKCIEIINKRLENIERLKEFDKELWLEMRESRLEEEKNKSKNLSSRLNKWKKGDGSSKIQENAS